MKIELNIDAANLGETVLDVFKTLTLEQKSDLAKDAVLKWINEPLNIENDIKDRKALAEVRKDSYYKDRNDSDCRGNYKYRDAYNSIKTSKEVLYESIHKEILELYKNEITKQIKEDPIIQSVMKDTLETLKNNYGKFVHDAMIAWFCQNMTVMSQGIQDSLIQTEQNQKYIEQLNNNLRNKGIY